MALREDEFQQQIIDLCKYLRLKWYHPYDSRRSVPGFPDLTIVGPGGLVFAELKSKRGIVTPEQRDWLDALRVAGQDVYVWRPADLEQVMAVLYRIASRRQPGKK